jgi:hypothetical protein
MLPYLLDIRVWQIADITAAIIIGVTVTLTERAKARP